jgi:7-dehydrocholesterol reductase
VWLPFLYTFQTHYLVQNPVDLSLPFLLATLGLGSVGYYIFRETNNQKDIARATEGKGKIWGQPITFIRTKYTTSDGTEHSSILLTCGFWGLSRHFNYFADLIMSLAMCMACGFGGILAYFYVIYMAILLVGRIHRDQDRCSRKYGKYWEEYCKVVPYKLIPGVW